MNQSFLAIVKKIASQQGESILADASKLKGFITDLARDEPKEDRIAFGRAIEQGFYMELKNTAPANRPRKKAELLPRLQTITGFDAARCRAAIDLIESVITPVTVSKTTTQVVPDANPMPKQKSNNTQQMPTSTPPQNKTKLKKIVSGWIGMIIVIVVISVLVGVFIPFGERILDFLTPVINRIFGFLRYIIFGT